VSWQTDGNPGGAKSGGVHPSCVRGSYLSPVCVGNGASRTSISQYGSKSKRGTEVAALFYTLFETAKLSGVDPRAYVTLAAKRTIADHGAVTLPSDLT